MTDSMSNTYNYNKVTCNLTDIFPKTCVSMYIIVNRLGVKVSRGSTF